MHIVSNVMVSAVAPKCLSRPTRNKHFLLGSMEEAPNRVRSPLRMPPPPLPVKYLQHSNRGSLHTVATKEQQTTEGATKTPNSLQHNELLSSSTGTPRSSASLPLEPPSPGPDEAAVDLDPDLKPHEANVLKTTETTSRPVLSNQQDQLDQLSASHVMPRVTSTTNLGASHAAAEDGDRLDEIPLLRQQLTAIPTSSRKLAFLEDLVLCTLALVPYLVMQAARWVFARIGVSEHRWKGLPHDLPVTAVGRQHLLDVASTLKASGNLELETLMESGPDRANSSSTTISSLHGEECVVQEDGSPVKVPTSTLILNSVQDVLTALQLAASQHGLKVDDAAKRGVACDMANIVARLAHRHAVNPQDVLQVLRHKGKGWLKKLAKQQQGCRVRVAVADYVFWCLMRQSLRIPSLQQSALLQLPDGATLLESSMPLNLTTGLEFLRSQGAQHEEQVAFMEQYGRLRPSSVKREWVAQATTINARRHSLSVRRTDGSMFEVASYLRSGAFAVHGRKPKSTGLSGLVQAAQILAAEDNPARCAPLLKRLGYHSSAALEPEIRIRSACCVAQALPVIVASLQQAISSRNCWEVAQRTGTFLHVQQSLLSDLNAHEHSYLEDTKGALDLLNSRLEIRFAPRPLSQLHVDRTTQRITLTLDSTRIPSSALPAARTPQEAARCKEELLGRAYRLQAVLFSQGVNVLQSMGFWKVTDKQETLQDALNREAVDAINSYAGHAGRAALPALSALNAHVSRAGKRAPKDTQLVQLVRLVAAELGASRAVNCKSGKDRTAIELSISASQHAVEAGWVPAGMQHACKAALQAGLSYRTTFENNGQPNAYAFNELELVCLPPGWRPPWQLCGKVVS